MEENDCLICFEDLDSKDKAILSCNHVIHYSCLKQWIKSRENITELCPICNNEGEILNIIDAKLITKDKSFVNKSINHNYENRNRETSIIKNNIFSCCNIL